MRAIFPEHYDPKGLLAFARKASAACVAMAQATDLMLDLKTGYLVSVD
ncbi:MAG: hypothetical protein V3R56_08445 [Xanthomonadales bacterium]